MIGLSGYVSSFEFRLQKSTFGSYFESFPDHKAFLISMELFQKLFQGLFVHNRLYFFSLLNHLLIAIQKQPFPYISNWSQNLESFIF